MFILREISRSIARSKGRSILTACIALCLMACMGLYLGTLEENRSALRHLSETLPVTVKVVNGGGSAEVGLGISEKLVDGLMQCGIREPVYTAQLGGILEEVNLKSEGKLCDTSLTGANTLDAFGEDMRGSIVFAEGWDESFLTGDRAVCLVESGYAQRHGVQAGDTLELPVYRYVYHKSGYTFQYERLAETRLEIIGTHKADADTAMIVPIGWMKRLFDEQGAAFTYDSFRCVVADALRLNDFKSAAEAAGFRETSAQAATPHTGNALLVQDKVFIETAQKLQNNIDLFTLFRGPFFLLLVGLIVLATFLLCRGRQSELAIERSLGRSRLSSGLGVFLGNILLYLPGLLVASHINVALAFLGCAAAGILVSVCLLCRFDPLALLTRTE